MSKIQVMADELTKKQMIFLHKLMIEVQQEMEDNGHDIKMENYQDVSIPPNAIHKNKLKHKRALRSITKDISNSIQETEKLDVNSVSVTNP